VSIRNNLKKSSELDAYKDTQKISVQNAREYQKKIVVVNALTNDRRIEKNSNNAHSCFGVLFTTHHRVAMRKK